MGSYASKQILIEISRHMASYEIKEELELLVFSNKIKDHNNFNHEMPINSFLCRCNTGKSYISYTSCKFFGRKIDIVVGFFAIQAYDLFCRFSQSPMADLDV